MGQEKMAALALFHLDVVSGPRAQAKALLHRLGNHVGKLVRIVDSPQGAETTLAHRTPVEMGRHNEAALGDLWYWNQCCVSIYGSQEKRSLVGDCGTACLNDINEQWTPKHVLLQSSPPAESRVSS